jgi:hypothetical protein
VVVVVVSSFDAKGKERFIGVNNEVRLGLRTRSHFVWVMFRFSPAGPLPLLGIISPVLLLLTTPY